MTLLTRDNEKIAEGENRLSSLIRKLLSLKRYDDIDKATSCATDRERLYREFGIIGESNEKETGVTLTKKYETFFGAVGNIDIDSDAVDELRKESMCFDNRREQGGILESLDEKFLLIGGDIKEEHDNKRFEEAVFRILQMKYPKTFRWLLTKEQSFELIYDISVYGIAPLSDERVEKCILRKYSRGENGELIDNYKDLDEGAKIDAFYRFFEKHVSAELSKYGCTDKKLIDMLNCGN